MTKPISGKAEVAIEYPDKLYLGTFEHTARYNAHLDEIGISLSFDQTGSAESRKSVRIHVNYALFADILLDLAATAEAIPAGGSHREMLRRAVNTLALALQDAEGFDDQVPLAS